MRRPRTNVCECACVWATKWAGAKSEKARAEGRGWSGTELSSQLQAAAARLQCYDGVEQLHGGNRAMAMAPMRIVQAEERRMGRANEYKNKWENTNNK